MPDVSVLLPCYNAQETLKEALDSLQSQTYSNFEIICVNDGSTDLTQEILEDRSAKDPRIRILSTPHGGVIQAANRGLEACRGEIIIRLDADDRCQSRRIELQREYLLEHPEVAVVSCLVAGFPASEIREGFEIYYAWLNSLVSHQDITREIFVESPIANPSAAFRHSWIRDLGGYQDHGWPEDYDLWLRAYLAGSRFAKIEQVLFEWREHPQRLTHEDPRYSLENFLRAKAHYLAKGPARNRDAVIIWGAGMTGRRLSKHLQREGLPLKAFVDVDPRKIGRTRRGKPIISSEGLLAEWRKHRSPILLTAVRARKAAPLIRGTLLELGLVEGQDWWQAA